MSTIGFVHTVTSLTTAFTELAEELVPGADVFHITDETLLAITRREGLTSTTRRRVLGYVESAAEAGADIVLVTCSSIGPAVDASREFVDVPVVRIDEAMTDEAVRIGSRIGVVATLASTLEPTAQLIERKGDGVTVTAHLCDGAFEALSAGDRDRHDELVRQGLRTVLAGNDVVVLAQASMARVVETLADDERTVPILSSPRLAVERVAALLA